MDVFEATWSKIVQLPLDRHDKEIIGNILGGKLVVNSPHGQHYIYDTNQNASYIKEYIAATEQALASPYDATYEPAKAQLRDLTNMCICLV